MDAHEASPRTATASRWPRWLQRSRRREVRGAQGWTSDKRAWYSKRAIRGDMYVYTYSNTYNIHVCIYVHTEVYVYTNVFICIICICIYISTHTWALYGVYRVVGLGVPPKACILHGWAPLTNVRAVQLASKLLGRMPGGHGLEELPSNFRKCGTCP